MLTDDAWSIKSAKIDERMIQVGLNEGRTLDVVHKEATSRSDFIGYDLASASANDSNPNAGASLSPPNYLVPNLRKLKVFVGGLPQNATIEDFQKHFSLYGDSVVDIEIKMDKITGRSRGFGFVTIQNCDSTRLFSSTHRLCGKMVDVAEVTETKLFVVGLRHTTTREQLVDHFQKFGTVVNCEIMQDMQAGQSARFSAFVVFETAEAAGNALYEPLHLVDERRLEVRKAEPRRKGRFPGSPFTSSAMHTPQGSPLHTPSFSATYGAFGGYGEYEEAPPPSPPQLTYGALGVPSSYGYPGPVPGYDCIPSVGSSNRFHPY